MKKRKNRFKKYFVIVSAVFLLGLIFAYSSRLIHYYRLENTKTSDEGTVTYFTDMLETTINLSDANGGLYITGKEFSYRNAVSDNYLWYSGNMWRILKINEDKTIDIVMEEALSMLYPKYEENDYLTNYLETFYEQLDDDLLVPLTYCNDEITDVKNLTCENEITSDIAILDIKTYNDAGGMKSFLNNSQNFWLINQNENGNYWSVNAEGALTVSNLALDIRPVVRLNSELILEVGKGSKDDPYILKQETKSQIKDVSVGEYVKYNESLFRIVNKSDNSISIKALECIKENEECLTLTFGKTNDFTKSSLFKYLNETYYKTLANQEFLVKDNFYIGNYANYDYQNLLSAEIESYIGISKIGDYYLTNDLNSFLLTANGSEMIYTINNVGNYYLNLPTISATVFPILNLDLSLKIESGLGTMSDPYLLSR